MVIFFKIVCNNDFRMFPMNDSTFLLLILNLLMNFHQDSHNEGEHLECDCNLSYPIHVFIDILLGLYLLLNKKHNAS